MAEFNILEHPDMERYKGRWYGKYRGIVTRNDDPKKAGRVTLHVPFIAPQDIETGEKPSTGWAWPLDVKPIMRIPPINAKVWVEFENGNIDKPLWSAGPHTFTNGISNADNHSKGLYDDVDNSAGKRDGSMPTSQFEGDYGTVESWKAGNNTIEIDYSSGKERILISHASGTTIEIQPDGTVQNYTSGNSREVTRGSVTKQIDGSETKVIRGPVNETYNGSHVVKNNEGLESIVIGDTTYTYSKLQENSKSKIIKITGKQEVSVGGSSSELVMGKKESIVVENSSMIVNNLYGIANPFSTAINLHAVNGEIELKAGPLPVVAGIDHSNLLLGVTRAQLFGPVVQIGTGSALAIHPATRSDVLITYLTSINAALVSAGASIEAGNLPAAGAVLAGVSSLLGQLAGVPSTQVLIS